MEQGMRQGRGRRESEEEGGSREGKEGRVREEVYIYSHQPPCVYVHVRTGGLQCVSSPLFWLCRQLPEHCRNTAGVAHEERVTVGTPLTHLWVRVCLEGCVGLGYVTDDYLHSHVCILTTCIL